MYILMALKDRYLYAFETLAEPKRQLWNKKAKWKENVQRKDSALVLENESEKITFLVKKKIIIETHQITIKKYTSYI